MKLYTRPHIGQRKTKIRFAWFPKEMTDRQVIWFEKYEHTYMWKKPYYWRF